MYYLFMINMHTFNFDLQRIPATFLTGLGSAGYIRINVEGHRFTVPVHLVINEGANNVNEYEVVHETWQLIRQTLNLTVGMIVVFTKEQNTTFWLMAFEANGTPHTNPHFFGATTLHEIQPDVPFEDQGAIPIFSL